MDNWRPSGTMIEKQQGMEVLGAYLSPPMLIKDQSLTALLSYWTHAPHLTGRISHSDYKAWTLSGPRVKQLCAVIVMVEENDEGTARNLGIPWIPQLPEWSSGTSCACRTHKLVLDSVIWWLLIFGNAIRNWSASARISMSTSPGKLSRVSYLFFYH